MRWRGKAFSLTYPKCTLTKEFLFEKLKEERNITYVAVSQEKHEDGTDHLHAQLVYTRRKDVKNQRYFDYEGFHPNVQVTRDIQAWNVYLKKDGNFVEDGQLPLELGTFNLFAAAQVMDFRTFMETCIEERIAPQYAKIAWDFEHQVDITLDEEYTCEGSTPPLLEIVDLKSEFKSIVIIGPSGVGKTVYAKRHATKPALFVSHIDDVKKFDPRKHKSIIFDDMSFTHYHLQGQIALADRYEPRSINVRYGVAHIPERVEKWFTCNDAVFTEHPAIARRINKINLY